MTLPLPTSVSPSKVSSFKQCGLAFRLSSIDKIPEPPTIPATRGSLVHRALQLLFWDEPKGQRTREKATEKLRTAWDEFQTDPEFIGLALDPQQSEDFFWEACDLLDAYYALEDPDEIDVVGVELKLEARVGTMVLRGIIDRLETDANGDLVVTDYKTGKAPNERYQADRLQGVHFYAFLCQRILGRRPVKIQLLHLGGTDPTVISVEPTEQSVAGLQNRTAAMWRAIEEACATDGFEPKPGPLCGWCSYKEYCPAFGGTVPEFVPLTT